MAKKNVSRALAALVILTVLAAVWLTFWASRQYATTYGPTLVAEDSAGNVWLLIDNELHIVDPSGNHQSTLTLTELDITPPVAAIEPLPDGSVLIGSRTTGLIHRVNADSQVVSTVDLARSEAGPLFGPFHLAFDAGNAELWIVDTSNHRLLITSPDGELLHEFGDAVDRSGPFRFPNDIELVEHGQALVVDTNRHQIKLLDRSLAISESFAVGRRANSVFSWPAMLERDAWNNLYVSVLSNGMVFGEVRKLDPQGWLQFSFELPPGAEPSDLLVRDDDILIVDQGNFDVFRFTLNGDFIGGFGDLEIRRHLDEVEALRIGYKQIELGSQAFLLVVLVLLLVSYATLTIQRAMRQKSDGRASAMVGRSAGRQVPAAAWALQRIYLNYLVILTRVFPYLPIIFAIDFLSRSCTLPLSLWQWQVHLGALLIMALVSIACYRLLYRHVRSGFASGPLAAESEKLLNRHRPPIAVALAPGETIAHYTAGQGDGFTKLLILTEQRLGVLSVNPWGRIVDGPTMVPLAEIEDAVAAPPHCAWWQALWGRNPAAWLEIRLRGDRKLAVALLDQAAAEDFCAAVLRYRSTADPRVQGARPRTKAPLKATAPGTAVLLSAMVPGAGQFVQGRLGAGLLFLVLAWYYLMVLMGPLSALILRTSEVAEPQLTAAILSATTIWAVSLADAYQCSKQSGRLSQAGI